LEKWQSGRLRQS